MIKRIEKAEVLMEALPFIQKFHGKVFVVKYGGHAMIDEKAKNWTAQDVVLLKYVGINPVVVHGGGPEINKAMEKMGKKPEFVHGLRITDEETLDIVEMVLAGKINGDIVSKLSKFGGKAVGLSGKSGRIILAKKKLKKIKTDKGEEIEVDLGRVGETVEVNTDLLEILINNNYIPVVSPIGLDERGEAYNLNADTVAGDIAGALKAEKLILITDVDGIMDDINDPNTIHKRLTVSEVKKMIEDGRIKGGMIPKVESALYALDHGVKSVHIINGKIPHALLLEIFTEEGIGTMITKD
ncbi:acetylglutamate kinase [Methanocaldococcus vulcanius M7]|uniref:Acetylglutamate kinase n=1 Tax=Methanocaldococcus vulcanius (strain ATCC 700851 / DSM 12094 / M7) TaxID=579137 RepID=C9REC1_METVM|nr:acetylglutamate kinase [Methanocaldococcus vulcanius]ACX71923.1 acetylglutamate kinase [Methanocaldococcus vulcanius M7]